jgi:hypothetical protein
VKVFARGFENVLKNFKALDARTQQAYRQGVRLEAERIMTASQQEVPVKTGRLKNSKFMVVTESSRGASILMGYRAHYAVFVHEMQKNYTVGKWKVLEDPMKRAIPGFDKRVAAFVQGALQ